MIPIPPLEVIVMDHDILKDDFLGSVIVDLEPCKQAPCTWAVDQFFKVDDPKYKGADGTFPEVYLQAYFVPDGMEDPNLKPIDKEGKHLIRDGNTI